MRFYVRTSQNTGVSAPVWFWLIASPIIAAVAVLAVVVYLVIFLIALLVTFVTRGF